ncbi:MAG: serine hydrolase [Thermoplasmatales archaeon]|nr:MAG: serine hydrolase [Thermoplasmatales archaeon]
MKKQILILLVISLLVSVVVNPISLGFKISKKENIESVENKINFLDTLFDLYIELLMKIGHRPSIATCIIYDDEVVWSKGYGYYDLEKQKETNEDILYLQASVSKTVTATALMQLYEQGLFDLDDDINDYLPFELRNPNHPDEPITIKMVLSHRSSLADDNVYWIALSYLPGDPDVEGFPYPWLEDYLVPGGSGYSSTTWSNAKPGEKFYYANIGFSIIAYLIEILSGQNFNEYCKENIFEPLQMHNSSFRLRDHDIDSIAVPYEYKNDKYFRHPHYGIHVLYPAITLRTSVEEYSHFIIAHMNDGVWNDVRILEKETVDLMHMAHFSPENKFNYGLGWTITRQEDGTIKYGHSGGYVGVLDLVTIKPAQDVAVIIFSNELDSELMSTYLERRCFTFINKAIFWKAEQIISQI